MKVPQLGDVMIVRHPDLPSDAAAIVAAVHIDGLGYRVDVTAFRSGSTAMSLLSLKTFQTKRQAAGVSSAAWHKGK